MEKLQTPAYFYDGKVINTKCRELKKNFPGVKLYYACKANDNKEIIKLIARQGFGVETVSPGEISLARRAGVPYSRMTFTCGSINERELTAVIKKGIRVHLDSLHQVEIIGKNFPNSEISIRLNQGIGAGHHSHVITGGPDSKFGIDISHIPKLKGLVKKYNLKITGLHQHIGSNVPDAFTLVLAMKTLFKTALSFPDLKHLDFGGGLGVAYHPSDKKLNIKDFAKSAHKLKKVFIKKYGRNIEMSFEPGRYLVAEAGTLLVKVTDIKENPKKTFVGVNSGFNHLIRPALYGSYHEIINLNNRKGKKEKLTIVGNICESGDFFAKDRLMVKPKIGDTLAIKNAGAYGYVMSSDYNSRPKPKEYLKIGDKIKRV
ncbi:MAG TPA: diaminopimelate decarboxylase [Candidatus Paceibacterota bacterium]